MIFAPTCGPGSFLLSPLGTIDFAWDQLDQNGQQVPPGDYIFDVSTGGGFFAIDFEVGGLESNIFLQGTAAIGTAPFGFNGGRDIAISSPSNPGEVYGVFVSGSLGVGPTFCGFTLPILPDALAMAALQSSLINNSVGFLDGNGETVQAALPIPNTPALVGIELHLAAMIFDLTSSCAVIDITPAFSTRIEAGIVG